MEDEFRKQRAVQLRNEAEELLLRGKLEGAILLYNKSIDIFPTVLEVAGSKLPGDRAIDGLSLMPHLKSGGTVKLQRDDLLWHFPHYRHAPGPYSIIRQGDRITVERPTS